MSRSEQQSHSEEPSARKEQPIVVQADFIPAALKEFPRPQWVCWSYVFRGEGRKADKQPKNPRNLHNAGVHWPNTWSTFEQTYTAFLNHRDNGLSGIGFVLTQDDDFIGIDLDNSVSEDGITEPALEIIQTLESYTEVSPSAQGLRIIVTSQSVDNFKSKELEMYSHSRYVTLTGNHVDGTPLEITNVNPSILQSLRPPEQPPHATSTINTPFPEAKKLPGRSDLTWEQIFRYDKLGAAHLRRFHGDLSLDHGDHSLAVLRLLNALARWSGGDAAQIRALMLQSPLANDKWFSKRGNGNRDWLDYQIADAINYVNKGNQR